MTSTGDNNVPSHISQSASDRMSAAYHKARVAWHKLSDTAVSVSLDTRIKLQAALQPHFNGDIARDGQSVTQKSSRKEIMDAVTRITDRLSWNDSSKASHLSKFASCLAEHAPSENEALENISTKVRAIQTDILAPCTHFVAEVEKVKPPRRWLQGQAGSDQGTSWPTYTESRLAWSERMAREVACSVWKEYKEHQTKKDVRRGPGVGGSGKGSRPKVGRTQ